MLRSYLLRAGLFGLLCILAPVAAVAGLNAGLEGMTYGELFPDAVFDPAIPTQMDVLGSAPAARPLRPEEVVAYFEALAAASPRATVVEFGRTHEGRPLICLAVSDAATVADLKGFQARHRQLMDPRMGGVPDAADLDGVKAVAWMAYGIHGDELSSTDAAAALAYRLVAGTDPASQAMRDEMLVLIDPCENPDGRARYLAMIGSFAHRTANPDPDDLSHAGVWPWGRGNHYLFDMNRDWFTMNQPESARSRAIAGWLPQLVVDSHEMGANSTYLFPPARHPFNPHLPGSGLKWEHAFSTDQAAALDSRGYPYFSGEWNEEFFPGYGSSWASYHGAVGILYEMSRTTGTKVRKRDGTVRTFAQAVEHQATSSWANLSTLRAHRAEVLSDHVRARAVAMEQGRKGPVQAWVLLPDARRPLRIARLHQLLTDQGIEVQVLAQATSAAGLTDARTGSKQKVELPAGALLVRLDQPAGNLARVLLDPHVPMDDVFFRDEREYLEKGKGSRLYETTAWSLPLLRGVPAFWAGAVPKGDWSDVPPPQAEPLPSAPPGPRLSLVIDAGPDQAPARLAELLQKGVRVHVARKDFAVGGRGYRQGALVIRREGNVDDLDAVLAGLDNRLPMHAVSTARAEDGPDLGGAEFDALVAPRVAVLAGMPVSPTAYGSVWHLLDQDLDLRFSALDIGSFARTDLSRYNVIVFPPIYGGTGMYRQILGETGLARLRTWIEAGGTAIGVGGGARLLADAEVGLTQSRFRAQALETYPSPVWSLDAATVAAAGRTTATGLRPEGAKKDGDDKDTKVAAAARTSPYDVAPILGPGARPFAAGVAQGTPLGGQPVRLDDWLAAALAPGKAKPEEADRKAADARLRRFMPQGALLRGELDAEAWLNYGLDEELTVWFGSDDSIVAEPPATVAAVFPDIEQLHLGGLLWPEAAARLARTGYLVREGVGRGQIVLFAERPSYRRWLADSDRLLANAVLLGPGLGTRWSSPW